MGSIPEKPLSRLEEWLAYLGGAGAMPVGAPYNREEEWFLYIAGAGDLPAGGARNRLEEWYEWIAANAGGGLTEEDIGKVVQADGGEIVLVQQTERAEEITENGTYDTTLNSAVTVNVAGSGDASTAPSNDVEFIDYDGTIRYSYSRDEFLALSALPEDPTHEGLISQGWNWTLAEAQDYVRDYGGLIIGQMYITDDGKTRVYITLQEGRISPTLGIGLNGTATIDWGDGGTDTLTGTNVATTSYNQHTYAAAGEYVISISVTGSMALTGGSIGANLLTKRSSTADENVVYNNAIREVELGANCNISTSAFRQCYGLRSVTLPRGMISIGAYAFYRCYSLHSVTIPAGMTRLGGAMEYAQGLQKISIPNSIQSIEGSEFSDCNGNPWVWLPSGLTSIGQWAFMSNTALAGVTIPAGVTSIGAAVFGNCYGLGSVKFMSATPPTVAHSNVWNSIPTDCVIYVPSGSLEAYTTATNYPSSSKYTYVEY